MSCSIEDITDTEINPTAHDGDLGRILLAHDGDAQHFLETVLGFLGRKTNFFKHEDPRKRVLDAYKQARGAAGGSSSGVKEGLKGGFFGASKQTAALRKADISATAANAATTQVGVHVI